MPMPSSGPISIGQARNECQQGSGGITASNAAVSKLAGVSPYQRFAWSWWYGKSVGMQVHERQTQYYRTSYSGANRENLQRNLFLYMGGTYWRQSGGDDTRTPGTNDPAYPGWPLTNTPMPGNPGGIPVGGFYRSSSNITLIVNNATLDGFIFQSSIGDSVQLTNDKSYSLQIGANLWTFYGASGAVGQGSPRDYNAWFAGPSWAPRAQPPSGYVNGQPPAPPPTYSGGGGNGHCFVAGSLTLMADGTLKPIEEIRTGDLVRGVNGPTRVQRLHTVELGHRRLMSFNEDWGHLWSEEHPHWVRQGDKQGWWAANPTMLRDQFASGVVRGLPNPQDLIAGDAEFATISGFEQRTPVEVLGGDPSTLLYVPVVENSPIVVNGYVVGGFLNGYEFDYSSFDWGVAMSRFTDKIRRT